MKIISGRLANHSIFFNKNALIRPTGAIVKKSLISTIRSQLHNRSFLDLFAGTGMVGMEAFSNGANYIGFLEKNFHLYRMLLKNMEKYSIPGLLLKGDYRIKTKFFAKKNCSSFDFIFIDPPYYCNEYEKIVALPLKWFLLKKGGLIIIEKRKGTAALTKKFQTANGLAKIKAKTLGDTSLEYYQKY